MYLFAICFIFVIYSYPEKFLSYIIYLTFIAISVICIYKHYSNIAETNLYYSANHKIAVDELNKYMDKNIVVFIPYGDELIKKYNDKIQTFDINRDKLFTMKNFQSEFSKLTDEDFQNKTFLQRKAFVRHYLNNEVQLKFLKKMYKEKISKLKAGDYFIILISTCI